jgi:hypothetical protein
LLLCIDQIEGKSTARRINRNVFSAIMLKEEEEEKGGKENVLSL